MPLAASSIIFANNPLDRAGHKRGNPDWLAAQLASKDALFLPIWKLHPLILSPLAGEDMRDIAWLPRPAFQNLLSDERLIVFLGINRRDKPLFAVDVSELIDPENMGAFAQMGIFEELRDLATQGDIAPRELAILAHAKALIDWHGRHRFCAQCGAPTHVVEGGHKRQCGECEAEHFPRTDPVVIMLATYDSHCLIGRQHGWPPNMYSALAGFIEPGESLEEAVAREMDEEAGVDISSVRYMAAQPWPFPSSLMLGCMAEATSDKLTIDGVELAEALWVSRGDIQAALRGAGTLRVPPPMAIAHHLIKLFAEGN